MKTLMCAALAGAALLAGPAVLHAEGAEPAPPVAAVPEPIRDEAAAKLRLARRFIALMQTDQMGAMISQMTTAMTPPRAGMSQAQSDAVRHAIQTATEAAMPRMFDAMAPIYADIFTMEELTGLVEFYESDIGRSMISKMYEAGPRMSEAAMSIVPDMMHDMADSMCKELGCSDEERARMDQAMAEAGYGPRSPAQTPAAAKKN